MGFKLTWTDRNVTEQGHRVYRSDSPMDPENLPTPIATLGPDVEEFEDGDVVGGNTYYYRVGAFTGTPPNEVEMVSEEIEALAVEPATIPRRFWRLLMTESFATTGFFFWVTELILRDTVGGLPVAPVAGGTPSASTRHSNDFGADKAFDSNTGTGWSPSDGAAPPQWLRYDFPEPISLAQIGIQAGDTSDRANRAPRSFILQSSENGSSWEDILEVTGEPAWGVLETRFWEL